MDSSKLTPVQIQYINIKNQYKDCILFFRLWDFYEVFWEDAKICSKILDITLTARNKKTDNPVPMAWVPYHSSDKYISILVKSGYKVAIAEQIWEVKPGQIVNREVVSIVTPWTFINEKDFSNYNFIWAINWTDKNYNFSWWDFSVWEYWTKSFDSIEKFLKFVLKLNLSELVIDIDFLQKDEIQNYLKNFSNIFFSVYDLPYDIDIFIKNTLWVQTLNSFGKALSDNRNKSFSLLINYLKNTQKSTLKNISNVSFWWEDDKIIFDETTIKNLEIFQSSYEWSKKYSLAWILDKTKTSMGSRLLNSVLISPLKDIEKINYRQNNIQYYFDNEDVTNHIKDKLKLIWDIPKIISQLLYKKNDPLLRNRLKFILKWVFDQNKDNIFTKDILRLWLEKDQLNNIFDFYKQLNSAIKDENVNNNIDYIRDWYNSEIDELRKIAYHSDDLLLEYQKELIQKTNIINLKIKYVNNQWYFIEINKKDVKTFESHISEDEKYNFVRRQTLKLSERYVWTYLNKIQNEIISSKFSLQKKEKEIIENFKNILESINSSLFNFANKISWIDLYICIAILSKEKNWVKPNITNKEKIDIVSWRHPVIEEFLNLWENFIPNDLFMDYDNDSDLTNIHIITWPNMWWKSTFLRQNALIVFLAHCGFWIPAQKWEIWLVDGIFARVWSGDVIAQNQSTFMTEMIEMSNILHNATRRSFVILDELWRWTSTYDWLALAKAIIIYLSQKIKSKILFATHYHELIKLEWKINWIKNFSLWVYETDKEVVFLKKIVKWWANKSYWIDVAKLAWIPKEVIEKSKWYLKDLENKKKPILQNNLFEWNFQKENVYEQKYQNLKNYIERINIDETTPIEALQILNNLRNLTEDSDQI